MMEHVRADAFDTGAARLRRGMLVRAMLAQNTGTGCAFGGLAITVLALQDRYGASLGMAAMALSLAVLSMTAFGPLIAGAIARWGLRRIMPAGVLLSLIGYISLAYAPSMLFALAACGLLIGPGAALFAALPPAVLAGGWYPEARGKVMGITYLPLFTTVIPVVGVSIVQTYGLKVFFLSLAALHLLLLPLMLGVVDPPMEALDDQGPAESPGLGSRHIVILGGAMFWMIAVADGILNGTAITGGAHILPIVTEYKASMEAGAMLLAVSGASSIMGSLFSGYACDRIGAANTLGLAGVGFAIAWVLLAITGWMPALVVSSFLIGLCGASVFPPLNALVVQIYGAEALPKVLGLLGVMTLPFTFLMSPAAGWLRDYAGNYEPVFIAVVIASGAAAAIFFGISRYLARNGGSGSDIPEAVLSPVNPT